MNDKKNILILYDHHEIHVKTIADYLHSFYRFSGHRISYVSSFAKCRFDLDYFDAIMVHYSVRMCHHGPLSASFRTALQNYQGLKVLFIQDEYENTDVAKQSILDLGFGLVFTCVPQESIAKVYPPQPFAGVNFVTVLTGFVPLELTQLKSFAPISQRSVLIGYRGRNIGYWYGDLGQEKRQIGVRMQQICNQRGLKNDIAWNEDDRIYGMGWFDFLGKCKATLGTESGANIFDFDGALKNAIQAELRRNPNATYEEIHAKFLRDREGEIVMNQISPKVFEAIACRTALILFEGRYSGVLEPGRHFISLNKDFSNIEEVLAMLRDDAFLEAMAQRAYGDVIGSGNYTYQAFVNQVDSVLEQNWRPIAREQPAWLPLPPADALPAFRSAYRKNFQPPLLKRAWKRMPAVMKLLLNRERVKRIWLRFPYPIRSLIQPILQFVRSVLKPAH